MSRGLTDKSEGALEAVLETLAYHVSVLSVEPAPARFGLTLAHGDVVRGVDVMIVPRGAPMLPPAEQPPVMSVKAPLDVWDQVWMRERDYGAGLTAWRWCGNRSGGRSMYARFVAPVLTSAALGELRGAVEMEVARVESAVRGDEPLDAGERAMRHELEGAAVGLRFVLDTMTAQNDRSIASVVAESPRGAQAASSDSLLVAFAVDAYAQHTAGSFPGTAMHRLRGVLDSVAPGACERALHALGVVTKGAPASLVGEPGGVEAADDVLRGAE